MIFKISSLKFFFWKYYFGHTTFLYLSTRFSGHHQIFLGIISSSRISQSQQKLAKKITHCSIKFRSKHLTHSENLNSLDIENNMPPRRSQKPFSFHKCSSKHVSIWCQKNHLHSNILVALHHILSSKNCILEALWNEMFVYFYMCP